METFLIVLSLKHVSRRLELVHTVHGSWQFVEKLLGGGTEGEKGQQQP
jgi:hypothetical protein